MRQYRVLNRKGEKEMKYMESSLSRVTTRVPWVLLGLVAAFSVFTLAAGCQKDEKAGPPGPPAVEVVDVIQKDVPIYKEWIGTTDGFVNATIRAQVQGYLVKQNYREGDVVKTGQALFEIDPRTFQAALDQSKGSLDQAKGILEQSKADVAVQEARWATAKANLARIKPLAEQNAVSQKDLDDAVGAEESTRSSVVAAKASVVAAGASVVAAQANLEKAALDLGFTKVSSPIGGIAGIAKAQIGNLVGPSSTQELTSVSTLDPIKVYINVSEQEYLSTRESNEKVEAIPLDLILADGSIFPQKGRFYLADRQVDVTTGTLKLGAIFPNPGNLLRPGQYGRIRAQMSVLRGALLVPQRAVGDVQGSSMVAVVGPDNKVDIRRVKPSEKAGSLWVIDEGLKLGEKVVAEGIQKVRQGMTVSPKPFVAEVQAKPETGAQSPAKTEAASKPEPKQEAPAKPNKR
jgi:membrane fusion protein (multidrug efflux system)